MDLKAEILDEKGISRTITRIAHEIIEKNRGVEDIVLIGIKTRGVPLAHRISTIIEEIEDIKIPVGSVDITYYRDDLCEVVEKANITTEGLGVHVKNKIVILVDDVMYTGRSVRAAMDAIIDEGRPQMIQLAVLVDRGHRELPIRADYVGKNIPTSHKEAISVQLKELDELDSIKIFNEWWGVINEQICWCRWKVTFK